MTETKLLDSFMDVACSGNPRMISKWVKKVGPNKSTTMKQLALEFVWKRWDMTLEGDRRRFDCVCDPLEKISLLVPFIPPRTIASACFAYKQANRAFVIPAMLLELVGRIVMFFVIIGMSDFTVAIWSCFVGWTTSQILNKLLEWSFSWQISMFATALAGWFLSEMNADPETLFWWCLWTTIIITILIFIWKLFADRFSRIATAVPGLSKLFPRPS